MGGQEIVDKDPRLNKILWQAGIVLEGKITLDDFAFILTYAETNAIQNIYLRRVEDYIKQSEKAKLMIGMSEKEIRMKQDEELVNEIKKRMKPWCYIIKVSLKKDLIDRVRDRIIQTDVD